MRWAPLLALRHLGPTTDELGYIGECIAARHLRKQGEHIVARRLRTRAAEIDLVVRKQHSYACVEVKTGRTDRPGPGIDHGPSRDRGPSPGSRLGPTQLARLQAAARSLGRETGSEVRVDLVEVCLDRQGRLERILVHRNLREPLRWRDASRLL